MMTSASPMAMSRSRVQTRISLRKECAVDDPEGEVLLADEAASGDSGIAEVGASFSSALSIFWLPSIYSTGVTRRARFGFRRCCPRRHQRMYDVVDWILGRGEMLPSRQRFERGLVEVLRLPSSGSLRMTVLWHRKG